MGEDRFAGAGFLSIILQERRTNRARPDRRVIDSAPRWRRFVELSYEIENPSANGERPIGFDSYLLVSSQESPATGRGMGEGAVPRTQRRDRPSGGGKREEGVARFRYRTGRSYRKKLDRLPVPPPSRRTATTSSSWPVRRNLEARVPSLTYDLATPWTISRHPPPCLQLHLSPPAHSLRIVWEFDFC